MVYQSVGISKRFYCFLCLFSVILDLNQVINDKALIDRCFSITSVSASELSFTPSTCRWIITSKASCICHEKTTCDFSLLCIDQWAKTFTIFRHTVVKETRFFHVQDSMKSLCWNQPYSSLVDRLATHTWLSEILSVSVIMIVSGKKNFIYAAGMATQRRPRLK